MIDETLQDVKGFADKLIHVVALADRDPVNILLDDMDFNTRCATEQIDGDLYYSQEWREHGKRGKDGDRVQAVRVKLDGTFDTHKVTLYCETNPTEYGEPDDYFWYLDEDASDDEVKKLRQQLDEANKKLEYISTKIKEELC